MDKIFNEKNYREYLENVYVHNIDKNNQERKKYIDKYSSEYLQKIIDDTKTFSSYVIDELQKENTNLIDSVFMNIELIKEKDIDSNLCGGWPADILYNPDGFDDNFLVSKHLLEEFLDTKIVIDEEEIEYYNEQEDAGIIISTPYISISMSKEQFKKYEKIITNEEKTKVLKK